MQKLFTITCTTCRARLAVRAEAAIGTILECPKCESMVHVIPPDGWVPPASAVQGAAASLPPELPPLDRVADSMTLELEAGQMSPFGRLLHQKVLLWGVGLPVATLAAVIAVLWFMLARPEPSLTAPETDDLAAAASEVPADHALGGRGPQSPGTDSEEKAKHDSSTPIRADQDRLAVAADGKTSETAHSGLTAGRAHLFRFGAVAGYGR